MEDTDLVRAGRQAVDSELAQRVGDERHLRALNDHVRTAEISSVQAIEDDSRDRGPSDLLGRSRRLLRRSWGLASRRRRVWLGLSEDRPSDKRKSQDCNERFR